MIRKVKTICKIIFVLIILIVGPIIVLNIGLDKQMESIIMAYYGCIITGIIAIVGVFLTVRYSQKQYHEDVINRSIPFIVIDYTENRCDSWWNDNRNYDDYYEDEDESLDKVFKINIERYNNIYFMISEDLNVKYNLKKEIRDTYIKEITQKNGSEYINTGKRRYCELILSNVGNGPAIDFCAVLNKKDKKNNSACAVPITIFREKEVHISLCIDHTKDIPLGKYELVFKYKDILGNIYAGKKEIVIEEHSLLLKE